MNTTDIAERAQSLKEQAAEKGHRLKEQAAETGGRLKDRAQDWGETAKYQVRRAGDAANEYVQSNTWKSIAIAAGLGCVIGFFLAKTNE